MKADLHCHSNFSDGTLDPSELIARAIDQDIDMFALTDHDTVAGLESASSALDSIQGSELTFINGVEFSATWNNRLLHIVGLNFDRQHEAIRDGVQQNHERRITRANTMFERFRDLGIELQEAVEQQLVNQHSVPTRPHFAQALINLGLVKDKNQAFKRYLGDRKPAYVPMQWPSLDEVAGWITDAGGVAVLAHPARYKLTRTKLIQLIKDMKEVGIQGIEVSTCVTDERQQGMLTQLALKHDLFASIGSDFHGDDQPWAKLGRARPLNEQLAPIWQAFS
jgi:predicted metal-dependent phosphoesterase TrpH